VLYTGTQGLVAHECILDVRPLKDSSGISVDDIAKRLIDYGFPRHEYYIPERKEGTVMCHYRHQAHSDPLILPGLQDVTAHVDFTSLAECAVEAGMDVAGYASQGHFLLGAGLMELLASNAETSTHEQQVMQAQAVKTLTMPHEMGELFKVIALTKEMEPGLIGFSMLDARGRL